MSSSKKRKPHAKHKPDAHKPAVAPKHAAVRPPAAAIVLPVPAMRHVAGMIFIAVSFVVLPFGLRMSLSRHYQSYAQQTIESKNKGPATESNALKAIRLFEHNGNAHYYLGSYYRGQNRFEEARRHLAIAERTTPFPALALHGLGEAYLFSKEKDVSAGVESFERGLTMMPRPEPQAAYAWYQAGRLCLRGQRWADAMWFFERAVQLMPRETENVALYEAQALFALGQIDASLARLLKQILATPEYFDAGNQLLIECKKTGRAHDGLRILELAMKVHGEKSTWRIQACAMAFFAGDYDRAIAEAEAALRLAPEKPEPHYFLGEVDFKRGEWKKAREHYSIYIESLPKDDAQIPTLKQRLAEIDKRLKP